MIVAFTTSDGVHIDGNFRKSDRFAIWDIGPDQACHLETIAIENKGGSEEERIKARIGSLGKCALVCTREINSPARAKLVAQHIFTLKTGENSTVEEIVARLQSVLRRNSPPPWMNKAMPKEPESHVRP